MRMSEGHITARTSMLTVNYVVCIVLSAAFAGFGTLSFTGKDLGIAIGLGMVNGFFYLASLLLLQMNIRISGVVLPSVFSRIGMLLVPIIVSIFAFGEIPNIPQRFGAVIAIAAILLINYRKKGKTEENPHSPAASAAPEASGPPAANDAGEKIGTNAGEEPEKSSFFVRFAWLTLLLLFLSDGFAAATTKTYRELGNNDIQSLFLLFIFTTAGVMSLVLAWKKGEKPGGPEVLYGAMLGLFNYLTNRFMLLALLSLPAIIVYPMRGVCSLLLITLCGVVAFRERLQKQQWVAVVMILVAVVLLNLQEGLPH